MLASCAGSFRPAGALATAERLASRRTRSEVPRERLRFFSNPTMPPERSSRTRPDRRTGARPNQKTRMKQDRRAGVGRDGPPQKAGPSSQRKPPARPRAAVAAMAIAVEEERRLRQRNRLTLEEDKPAVERCLEELVFGDVEDNEDALLQRLRGPRVRESAACELGALGRGTRWAASLRGRSRGDLRRRGNLRWEGARERGRRGGGRRKVSGGRRSRLSPPPWQPLRLVCSRRSTRVCLANCGHAHLS